MSAAVALPISIGTVPRPGKSASKAVEEMIEQIFDRPLEEEKNRARRALEKLTNAEMRVVTRLVLEEEKPEVVARRLKMGKAKMLGILATGLSKLCKNGHGVSALCGVVSRARELGY